MTKIKFFTFLIIATLFLTLPACRRSAEEQQATAPSPPPATSETRTITTTGGGGTTATYQVQESAPNDPSRFKVTPSEARPGQRVALAWNVPDAEADSVQIEGVNGVFATEGSLPTIAPESGTAFRTNNATSATTDLHIYRLNAKRKGTNEPIRYETQLRIELPAGANNTSNTGPCPEQAPEGSYFTVSSSDLVRGQKALLSWKVPGASRIIVAGNVFNGDTGTVEVVPPERGESVGAVQRPLAEATPGGYVPRGESSRNEGARYTLKAAMKRGCQPVTMELLISIHEIQ